MDFNELLQIAREFLTCPVCGELFANNKIHFRGFIDNKFIIQTECENKHNPVTALFISSVNLNGKQNFNNEEQISSDYVLDLKLKLNQFDGNFENIFREGTLHGTI